MKIRWPLAALAFVAAILTFESWVLLAQKPDPVPPPVFIASGRVHLSVAGTERELPFAATATGPLFGLEAVATELGGRLVETAAGRGFELSFANTKFLLGIESPQVVSGQKIHTLTQRPVHVEGTLLVPLDFLEFSFGRLGGYTWSYDEATRRLTAERPNLVEVEAAVDLVHLQGTSTLVLRFPSGAPRYSVERVGQDQVEVRLEGGAFSRQTDLPAVADPLVRGLHLGVDRLLIELAPGVDGEHYELKQAPFRLVFDFHQAGPALAPTAPSPTLLAPRGSGVFTVVLDPGHGGGETGALGKNGTVEKELTLLLAQEIKRQLEAAMTVRVILTRSGDEQVGLLERTAVANENKADLLISVHLNSSLSGRPFGAETYFLSLKASDRQAAASAELENRSLGGENDDLELILWDLAQARHLARSQHLANLIQGQLNVTLGLKDRGVKQAPFKVLIGAQMPAVLVEFGFLSNPDEEAKLKNSEHRSRLAAALVAAVKRYQTPEGEVERPAEPAPAAAPDATQQKEPPPGDGQ